MLNTTSNQPLVSYEPIASNPPGDFATALRLNLGCGSKRIPGFLGIDIGDGSAVDVRMDVMEYLRSLSANSVQEIYSRHFLEHVDGKDLRPMLLEFDRVLRPEGRIHLIMPHYSNPYFYSDPTHRLAFGVHTFSYFCDESCLNRTVPKYATIPGWSLRDVKVGFIPYARPKIFGFKIPMLSSVLVRVVNRGHLSIELFERYLCGLWSIYEVHYRIEKRVR